MKNRKICYFMLCIFLFLAGCGADVGGEGENNFASIFDNNGMSVNEEGQTDIMENPAYSPMGRQVLTVGITWPHRETLDRILAFNDNNSSYFIDIKSYYTGLDVDAAINLETQLSLDILSGKGPDLMIWDNQFYTPSLVSEKLMENLYVLMDTDPDFHREDYFENILQAFEINEGLYILPASFTVYAACGKAEELGVDRGITESWELGEMLEAYENSPHAELFSDYLNKENTLRYMCGHCMDNFVDWSKGECHFDTPEFVELLEFCKTLPEGFDCIPDSFSEAFRSGKIFLDAAATLCDPWSMADVRADFGDADLCWPGVPVPDGEKGLGGGVAKPWGECFSICRNSSSQKAAWEVIKWFITEDAQRETEGNPLLRSVFEERLRDAQAVEYETINGVAQEKIRYEVVLSERGDMAGFSCITEEDAEIYRSIIENTHRSYGNDRGMMEIILEEAGAYFDGDKDAATVADIIQNRVSMYVSERME